MLRSRSPLRIPETVPGVKFPTGFVSLHHPGYASDSLLLSIPAYFEDDDGNGCIPYDLAFDACFILSGNRAGGFFTTSKAPNKDPVVIGSILKEGDYYFHLGPQDVDTAEAYATIRSFRDWKFEEAKMRHCWRQVLPSNARVDGQKSKACCFSGMDEAVEDAHLIPVTEHGFFMKHEMLHWATSTQAGQSTGRETYNSSNILRLRRDLHKTLDEHKLCLFPLNGNLCAVFMQKCDIAAKMYHGRAVRGGLEETAPQYAYARFAMLVFSLYEVWFHGKRVRRKLFDDNGGEVWLEAGEVETWRRIQMRNTSPTKRSRSTRESESQSRSRTSNYRALDVAVLRDGKRTFCAFRDDSGVDCTSDRLILGDNNGIDEVERGRSKTRRLDQDRGRTRRKIAQPLPQWESIDS